MNVQIACPGCRSQIHLNPAELVMGASFCCPGCTATVAVAMESLPVVRQALQQLESARDAAASGESPS